MTASNDLLQRIGTAAIRKHVAEQALEISEGKQIQQARVDRTELSAAGQALRALIAEVQS